MGFRQSFSTLIATLAFVAVLPMFAFGQELNESERQLLASVQGSLKHIETNLNLALSSAGSGTGALTGSKARLTQVRLNSAVAALPDVKKRIAELPADQAPVKECQTKLDELQASIEALEVRLGKQPEPKVVDSEKKTSPPSVDVPKPAMNPSSEAVKMSYQQVDVLKGAKFNLREVEGNCRALEKLLEELERIEDKLGIDYRKVRSGMATIENAARKAGFAKESLQGLPGNGEGVAEAIQSLEGANATIARSLEFLKPIDEKLTALIDPKNYPQLQSDLDRLNQLSSMYRDPSVFQTDRARAASVVKELDAAQKEAKRIALAYSRLIQQQTEEGKRIAGSSRSFERYVAAFVNKAEAEKLALPKQIDADLEKVDQMATNAVEGRKPLFFTGGIPQAMGFVEEKIELLKVLDPTQAKELEASFVEFKKELGVREKSLAALIIEQNKMPSDSYRGDDRSTVIDVATDAWTYQEKDFEVLASRIPAATWARETKWEYNNGTWYFVDRSKLQVQLIVADKTNKAQAIIRPVTVIKDHQKGDAMIGKPMYSGKDRLQPSAYLLRSNIK